MPRKTWSYLVGEALVLVVGAVLTRTTWRGLHNVPPTGGILVVTNHLSHADPFIDARFLRETGRLPRFMAKESILRVPIVGRLLARAGQIPVKRESAGAAEAFAAAVEQVRAGECVVIYPEGTLTRDPDLWPMRGKTGAARIALATGCPVIPAAKWGTQDLLPQYSRRVRFRRRTRVSVVAGPPLDLPTRQPGQPIDGPLLTATTNLIIDAVTDLVAQLRAESPPGRRWDPQAHGQPEIGDFKNPRRRTA